MLGFVYNHGQNTLGVNQDLGVKVATPMGNLVGQLLFGVLADRWSRTGSLLVSTVILIIFTALAAGSYYRGDPVAMFNMLTAWRFFVSRAPMPLTPKRCPY